jgi:hypothetical protein
MKCCSMSADRTSIMRLAIHILTPHVLPDEGYSYTLIWISTFLI